MEIIKKKKVKFGILCKSRNLRAWEAECIEQILTIEDIRLALLIHPAGIIENKKRNLKKKLASVDRGSKLLFYLYEKFFLKPKCYSKVDLSDKFKDIPYIYCATEKKESSEYFTEKDLERIKSVTLDFIILFSGFNNIKGEILNSCKYGVWLYYSCDTEKYRGIPPCFWEIYNNDNVTGVTLQKLTSKSEDNIILRKGFYKTLNYSYSRNLENAYFQSAKLAKEVCVDLQNCNTGYIDNYSASNKVRANSKPNNTEFTKFSFKILKNKVIKIFRNLFVSEQWNIGYINSSIKDFLKNDKRFKINWLLHPSKKEYFSDPFVIRLNNSLFVLFENFNFNKNKANISSININSKIDKKEIKLCMEKPYHLSYPFVFRYNNETYMIPEACVINKVVLYKAKNFLSGWQKVSVLIENFPAVDTTLFNFKGRWWLTCTSKLDGPDLRLFIYYSKDLLGPWLPHKKNPVKTDIRSSRPAGNIIKYNDSLIRPAQDCSKTYGGRIVLNKINKLTPFEFSEETIKYIEPFRKDRFNKGIHTINSIGNTVVFDGKRKNFSLYNLRNVRKKFLKI